MKRLLASFLLAGIFFFCAREVYVQSSGRMGHGDFIVSKWVGDSIYNFPLDEN